MKYMALTLFVYKYLQSVDLDNPTLEGRVYEFLAYGKCKTLYTTYIFHYLGGVVILQMV